MSETIQKAVSVVRRMNADDRMRELVRIREDAALTESLVRSEAMREGFYKAKIETAQSLKGMGMEPEQIVKATNLPIDIIRNLSV